MDVQHQNKSKTEVTPSELLDNLIEKTRLQSNTLKKLMKELEIKKIDVQKQEKKLK